MTTVFQQWSGLQVRLRDRKLRGPLLFTISSGVKVVVAAVSSLIVARMVLPEDLGTWQSVAILQPYLLPLSLGLHESVARQFAFLTGANEQDEAFEIADTGFTYSLVWGIFNILITQLFLIIGWRSGSNSKTLLAYALFNITAISFPISLYLHSLYRSGKDFGRLGAIQLAESVYAIAAIAFVYFWGWTGLFIRNASVTLLEAVLRFAWRPVPLRLRFSWSQFRLLIKMGLPRLLISTLYSYLMVADRTLITAELGNEALGFYALALIMQQAIVVFPTSMTQVIQTYMTVRYGMTKSSASIRYLTFMPVAVSAVMLLVPVFIGILLVEPFVNVVLPNYKEGVGAARLMILAGYFISLRSSAALFGTLDRLLGYTVILFMSLGIMYLSGGLALHFYGTIESIAVAKVLTMAFFALSINVLAYWMLRNEKSLADR